VDESLEWLEGELKKIIKFDTNAELVGMRIIARRVGRRNLKAINFARVYGFNGAGKGITGVVNNNRKGNNHVS
jgi:hypothetical protein